MGQHSSSMGQQHSTRQLFNSGTATSSIAPEFFFHLFPNVPLELKTLIWEYAEASSRGFEFNFKGSDKDFKVFNLYDTFRRYALREFEPLPLELTYTERNRTYRELTIFGSSSILYARKKSLPASGAASVRSVAVSGLLEIATIWDYGNINTLTRRRYEAILLEKRSGPATLISASSVLYT
ncbi:uncharacterized protein RAG0_10847 [Rhynchosporium agropyri]|uniref:Uncharacterized protein n=1 Tax=Rhynchosporium agropyri TaxID=914238 RepID=A0A1E1L1H3_9HELO|nr:uncharacterized protein RAG0_10847 [Rhynchosporium agropyri]